MQQSLFDDHNTPMQLNMPDGDVVYYPEFLPQIEATELMQKLFDTLKWQQDKITLYGKTHDVPRLQAWYGDSDSHYHYTSLTMKPLPWTQELWQLKGQCENVAQTKFNSVLANLYRDGQDGVGRHADDEPELGKEPVIASVSFGETRNLDFQHNHTKQKMRLALEAGSLLVMKGKTQTCWQHGVAKTKQTLGPRINLTFRFIHPLSEL